MSLLWPAAMQAINFCCNSGPLPLPSPLPFQNNHVEQVTFRRRERDCLVWRLRDDKGLSRELFCITGVAVLGADVRQLQRILQANPEDK